MRLSDHVPAPLRRALRPVANRLRAAAPPVAAAQTAAPGPASAATSPPEPSAPPPHPRAAEIAALNGSGLFDPAWYRATQMPPGHEDEPALHYLEHGVAAGLPAGPLFDTGHYLENSRWVRAFGTNPVLHALEHPGRPTRNANLLRGRFGDASLDLSIPAATPQAGILAVVVHAFYLELFEEICLLLRNIPVPFVLLVGIPSAEGEAVVREALARHGVQPARLACAVAPNRGRNFGTLFALFGEDVAQCDIVLHLHTKRSLYTGGDRRSWRDEIYGGLAGTPWLVQIILQLFQDRPELGLVYPTIAADMPYWAHHWLANVPAAAGLLARMGMAPPEEWSFLDFPVGGMFWARVDAIRPLLDLRLGHGDFPEEAGQTDGTTAHALERLVGLVCARTGHGFVEYDHRHGAFLLNASARNLHQYEGQSLDDLRRLAQGRSLVSFDVFDTLLARPALKPDAVMRLTGWRLGAGQPPRPDFLARRKAAEAAARARRHHAGDVTLDEIYDSFATDAEWTPALVAAAKEAELALDAHILQARPMAREMLLAAREAGARVVAITDTYYRHDQVAAMLEHAGLAGLLDHLYVSSAERARKDRGDLWDRVAAAEGVAPAAWLHVGDNEHSDIQAACDRGMAFLHVMRPPELLAAAGCRATGRAWADSLLLGPAVLRLAGNPFLAGQPIHRRTLHTAGEVGQLLLGPMVFAFLAWLIRHEATALVDRLCFLSREGLLLHRCYEALSARLPDGERPPPGHYLLASRRAVLLAAQAEDFSPSAILAGAGYSGSAAGLLRARLGLELPPDPVLEGWVLSLPEEEATAAQLLEVLRPAIAAQAAVEAQGLRAYLRGAGLGPASRAGVVDVGYSATIQTHLQTVLGRPLAGFYVASWDKARSVEPAGGAAFGWLAEDAAPWSGDQPAIRHSLLLEAMLTAPHGQVASFGPDGAPRFKPRRSDEIAPAVLAELHDGAVAYCEALMDAYGPALLAQEFSHAAAQAFFAMMEEKRLALCPALARQLVVEDEFCGNPLIRPME